FAHSHSYLFFSYYSDTPRDLHSFPTRRSSDLLPDRHAQDGAVDGGQPLESPPLQMCRDQIVDVSGMLGNPARHRHRVRVQWSDVDRKSTRLNSSHVAISYAVFCLKKKT